MRSVPLIIIAVANVVQFVCLLAGSAGIAELMIFHPVCIALPHFFFLFYFFSGGLGHGWSSWCFPARLPLFFFPGYSISSAASEVLTIGSFSIPEIIG